MGTRRSPSLESGDPHGRARARRGGICRHGRRRRRADLRRGTRGADRRDACDPRCRRRRATPRRVLQASGQAPTQGRPQRRAALPARSSGAQGRVSSPPDARSHEPSGTPPSPRRSARCAGQDRGSARAPRRPPRDDHRPWWSREEPACPRGRRRGGARPPGASGRPRPGLAFGPGARGDRPGDRRS